MKKGFERVDREGSSLEERLGLLRGMMAERFPEAVVREQEAVSCGFGPIDERGALPVGAVTELVASRPSCGGQSAIRALLERVRRERGYLALVDATDRFDPQTEVEELLPHLLWVRCREVEEALRATDLLVRDGNIETILLDLRGVSAAELRRQPTTLWFRLQRMVARGGGILVVLSEMRIVAGALLSIDLGEIWGRGEAVGEG